MKVIINGTVYEMDKSQKAGVLTAASKYVPYGIYAVEKEGICELKNHRYKTKSGLDKAVKKYEEQGFKVYKNGGALSWAKKNWS